MGRHSLRSHHKSQRYQAIVETISYLLPPSMSLRRDQAKNELSSNCSLKSGTPKSAQTTTSFQPCPDLLAAPWPHSCSPCTHQGPGKPLLRENACLSLAWHQE